MADMKEQSGTVRIEPPPRRVREVLEGFESYPEWMSDVRTAGRATARAAPCSPTPTGADLGLPLTRFLAGRLNRAVMEAALKDVKARAESLP